MEEGRKKEEPKRIEDEEYIGNIWGWRFSYISLAIILAALLLMLARYCYIY